MGFLLSALTATCLLSACTADTSSTNEHGIRPHLTVDLKLPQNISTAKAERFSIELQQEGKPAAAEKVTFEFWPEGNRDKVVSVPGSPAGEGVYIAEFHPQEEGLYMVRSFVASGPLEAMPAKRFAIGEQAVLHLSTMEKGNETNGQSHADSGGGGHHDH